MCEKYSNNRIVESNRDIYKDGKLCRNLQNDKKLLTTITTGELTKF